jgi:hypothetical protein
MCPLHQHQPTLQPQPISQSYSCSTPHCSFQTVPKLCFKAKLGYREIQMAVYPGDGIKTFRTKKKIEGLLKVLKQCRLKSDSLPWNGTPRFAFQCFWLLFSD